MEKEERIDYLQWSATEVPEFLGNKYLQVGSPLVWYMACNEYECGTRVLFGNRNSEKYLIQMSGVACENHQMTKNKGRLSYALMRGGKFSRVDLAVTIDKLEPLFWFRAALAKNRVVSERFQGDEPKVIADVQGDAQTIYYGDMKKRGKKGLFRAYNKGLEQGLDEPLARFELEIRRSSATVAVRRYVNGMSISALIRAVVDIPDAQWWVDIFDAPPDTLPKYFSGEIKDVTASRWHWLRMQVAPALGKLLAYEGGEMSGNYIAFMDAVNAARREADRLPTQMGLSEELTASEQTCYPED